jgi:predicted ATPase
VLRDCIVLAIEGTHASGKTTLTHALAAHYRQRGIHVTTVAEPARNSPFIEEIVVHGKGQFDLETEADLFAAQLSAQLRAARQHAMIIADKTIANVMAYARLVLQAPPGSREAAVLDAMNAFCQAWAPAYDAVFYCCDRYAQHQHGDPYRARVLDLQAAADRVVRSTCATAGQRVIDIPPTMTTAERVHWITTRVTRLGITTEAEAVNTPPQAPIPQGG